MLKAPLQAPVAQHEPGFSHTSAAYCYIRTIQIGDQVVDAVGAGWKINNLIGRTAVDRVLQDRRTIKALALLFAPAVAMFLLDHGASRDSHAGTPTFPCHWKTRSAGKIVASAEVAIKKCARQHALEETRYRRPGNSLLALN